MREHEDNIKKEFERLEGNESQSNEKIVDLGRVENPMGTRKVTSDDPEIRRINELTGYIGLDLSKLPSSGKFYRDDFEIHIRPARVSEIRDFSTMDEESIRDVDEKLNSILVSCTKVMYGKQRGSYKDILEEDRIYVILSIRELTFKDGESKLMMPVKGKKCQTSSCNAQESVELRTDTLQYQIVDDLLEKYYNPESKCYAVETKNHGIINMAPPTIGVMRAVTEWVRQRESEGKSWDKSFLAIIPYLQREWRGWDDKEIFNAATNLQGWGAGKYSLVYRLAEKMKIGIKPEMKFPCQSCGAEVTVPLTFPGGIKALFVISDIDSELL